MAEEEEDLTIDVSGEDLGNLPEDQDAPDTEAPEDQDDESLVIELEGDDEEDELLREADDEPPLQKKLRSRLRAELTEKHKIAQERDNLRRAAAPEAPKIVVGERPTLEDHEWDEEKHSEAVEAWVERKRQAAEQDQAGERVKKAQEEHNQKVYSEYREKAAQLKAPDFDEAEATVVAALPDLLGRAVLNYAGDPAKVVYALHKYPARLEALRKISDPIMFMKSIWEMERNLKVTTRKKPPEPESGTIQRGSAQASAGSDKVAEKLLADAQRSGNMDKYRAHMRAKAK